MKTILELQEELERVVVSPYKFDISDYSSESGGILSITHGRDCVYSEPFQTIRDCFEFLINRIKGYQSGEIEMIPIIKLSPRGYVDTFCTVTNMPKELLLSKTRKRVIVQARQVLANLIYLNLNHKYSLSEIGFAIGKDHATVLHCTKTVRDLRETNSRFRAYYESTVRQMEKHLGSTIQS